MDTYMIGPNNKKLTVADPYREAAALRPTKGCRDIPML